jgi:pyruvate formate lyase activating enzyme
MGYETKLDTNASAPRVVEALLKVKLLDYVAVDYKAPLDRYPEICGAAAEGWQDTVALLKSHAVPWELRTTVIPQFATADLVAMAPLAADAPHWYLQQYNIPPLYKPQDRFRIQAKAHTLRDLEEMVKELAPLVPGVEARG